MSRLSTLQVTPYEADLLIEGLTRAISRRTSMGRATPNKKSQEHFETATQMSTLRARLVKAKEAA